jgi:hypothetical protein
LGLAIDQKRIKQTQIQRDATRVADGRTAKAIADLDESYAEARAAQLQLDLLDQSHGRRPKPPTDKAPLRCRRELLLQVVDAQANIYVRQTTRPTEYFVIRGPLPGSGSFTGT